jgi:hypothetical protein
MHPLWQIKQIVMVDKERDVDHNNCFGGRGSAGVYIAFNALVMWIANNKRMVPDLWTYMDDSFGIDECRNKRQYHQYGKDMPANQVKLLSLWDNLGIPHEPHKQVFREKLTVIGIEVNANSLTLTLPSESLNNLLEELQHFTAWSEKKKGAL